VPEVSRFYGIVIKLFFNEHDPPHFHAEYGSERMAVRIDSLSVMAGKLSPRALGLVMEWASLHQKELLDAWQLARNDQSPGKITPLS